MARREATYARILQMCARGGFWYTRLFRFRQLAPPRANHPTGPNYDTNPQHSYVVLSGHGNPSLQVRDPPRAVLAQISNRHQCRWRHNEGENRREAETKYDRRR